MTPSSAYVTWFDGNLARDELEVQRMKIISYSRQSIRQDDIDAVTEVLRPD